MKGPIVTALKWLVSLGVGALFVWLSVEQWPVDRILQGGLRIRDGFLATDTWRVSLGFLPAYFLTLVVMHAFRVWRWQPLLKPLGHVDVWTLNRVCSVGFMAVFLLPMRFGELVRPALIGTEAPIRRTAALATIVVERVIDGVMVAGFLAVALAFMPRTESWVELRYATLAALIGFGGLVIVLVLSFLFRREITAFTAVTARRVSGHRFAARVAALVEKFMAGLSIFPDAKNFLWFLFLSFCYWSSNGVGLFVLAEGFEVLAESGAWVPFGVPLLGAFAMMSTIVVGMMIPNAPANVGSFWFFLLWPLKLYGIGEGNPAALPYALMVWSLQLLQLLVFGGWFLARGQVSFRRAFTVSLKDASDDRAGDGAPGAPTA